MNEVWAFVLGSGLTILVLGSAVVTMKALGLLKQHDDVAQLKAQLEVLRTRVQEDRADTQQGIINLTARIDRAEAALDGNSVRSEQIPSGREVVGAVEGLGQDE